MEPVPVIWFDLKQGSIPVGCTPRLPTVPVLVAATRCQYHGVGIPTPLVISIPRGMLNPLEGTWDQRCLPRQIHHDMLPINYWIVEKVLNICEIICGLWCKFEMHHESIAYDVNRQQNFTWNCNELGRDTWRIYQHLQNLNPWKVSLFNFFSGSFCTNKALQLWKAKQQFKPVKWSKTRCKSIITQTEVKQ